MKKRMSANVTGLSKEGLGYLLAITGLPDGSKYEDILGTDANLAEFAELISKFHKIFASGDI